MILNFKVKLCFLILLIGASSWADCGLTMTTPNVSLTWDPSFVSLSIQIVVHKANDEACNFGIGFSKGGAATYPNRRAVDVAKVLPYQLYQDNAFTKVLKDFPDITSANDVIQGGFGTGVNLNQTVQYYLVIPFQPGTGQSLYGAGIYADAYNIHLYLGADPTTFAAPVATTVVNFTPTVNPAIALSLVDSGAGFLSGATTKNLSLGELRDGQSAGFDLFVRTNAGFSISISSLNNSSLKTTIPGGTSTVPYRFYLNSVLVNLVGSSGAPVVALTGSGQTSNSGLAYPVLFKIGPLAGSAKLAGPHADAITVTAITTE